MRKIYLPLLTTLLLLGCSGSNSKPVIIPERNNLDYSDFKDIELEWKNAFLPAKSQYFIYIYSFSCSHCNNIKNDVLKTIDEHREMFYLTSYTSDIKTKNNVSETIGKERVEDVYILGTPTLLEISNHYVALNIAGEKEILEYLELLPHKSCS